ncbi:MAG: HlyD family efflux transporter periplasmic adaptor subunit [Fibrobacteres bacterium]|nr:HlyD family efflux transporter periplasmic adaptor subunit [Fibrobacterota bacterium]
MHRKLVPSKLSGFVWLATLVAVGVITWHFRGARRDFRGIAEDVKLSVSSEMAVELLSIAVQPGQFVQPGDTLARLRNRDLSMRIAEILREIQDASGEANIDRSESMRRVAELKSSLGSRKAELQSEIQLLSEQASRNRSLVSGFQGMGIRSTEPDTAGIEERIRTLREQIRVEEEGVRSQIALLEGSKGNIDRLAVAKNDALRKELALLHDEERKLVILAPAGGVIDSVKYRPGEKVSPFSPVLTISGMKPSRVRGYINERVRSDIAVGDSVVVSAVGMRTATVNGVVVGVGSRIMEIPVRLWKVPDFPLWGREVIVQLSSDNPLLLGEMVDVRRGADKLLLGGS